MGISMLNIRRSWDCLIFNMGIPISSKSTSLYCDSALMWLKYSHRLRLWGIPPPQIATQGLFNNTGIECRGSFNNSSLVITRQQSCLALWWSILCTFAKDTNAIVRYDSIWGFIENCHYFFLMHIQWKTIDEEILLPLLMRISSVGDDFLNSYLQTVCLLA